MGSLWLTWAVQLEIHEINEDTKDDVASWVRNAKSLQEDIIRSKAIANDIIRQSETPDVSGKTIEDAETKIEFLSREAQYVQQLDGTLRSIRHVNSLLSRAEQASNECRILDSLHLLEGTACVSMYVRFATDKGRIVRVMGCYGCPPCWKDVSRGEAFEHTVFRAEIWRPRGPGPGLETACIRRHRQWGGQDTGKGRR
ncbi:hypothetical protein IMZ48_14980 [Candidatus Bathyarchaeota archaeon]|nr:hypothetical protein [Candidatus Bathyarchaeota archaeon]